MSAVREFGRTLLSPLGEPSGTLETYIEVPFTLDDRTVTPDGLIRAVRGKRGWTVLVEVKTGDNRVAADQLEPRRSSKRNIAASTTPTRHGSWGS